MILFSFILPFLVMAVCSLLGFAFGHAMTASAPHLFKDVGARRGFIGISTLTGFYISIGVLLFWDAMT